MSPEQFLAGLAKGPAPVYLFLGRESYQREACRRALVNSVLSPEERESGLVRHELNEVSLAAVLDDARSLSLFNPNRVIWAAEAEAVLPRPRAGQEEAGGAQELLAGYLEDPAPGVVLVFEASRFDFGGEDKPKIERVRKFYARVGAVVEFQPYTPAAARRLAQDLARRAGVSIGAEEIEMLVEALGADAARVAAEMEKLSLFAGAKRGIGREDIALLVPDARSATVFALVDALGRRDRMRALAVLDTLVREGEYLPLALTFLATLFRLGLAATDAGLRGPQQVQAHLSRSGIAMWPARAQQVWDTMHAFSPEQMAAGLKNVFAADRALRDTRPDDRLVMEDFVLSLTR